MAYRFVRAGTLEVYTEGRRMALVALGALAFAIVCALGGTVISTGWQNEMLGGVAALLLLAGIAGLVLRNETFRVTHQGVQHVGEDDLPRPDVRVTGVRIGMEMRASSSSNRQRSRGVEYCVDLVLDDAGKEDTIRAFSAPSEPVARQAAEEIAMKMMWPFEDAIGDELDVRQPDALDRRADRKPAPTEAPPKAITVVTRDGSPALLIDRVVARRQKRMLPIVFAGALGATLIAAVAASMWLENPLVMTGIAMMVALDVVALGVVLEMTKAREEIHVDQGVLRRQLVLGSIRLPASGVDLRRVERIRIQTKLPMARGVVLVSNDETLRLGRGLDTPALRWLQSWLQSELP